MPANTRIDPGDGGPLAAERSGPARFFFPTGWTTRLAVMRLICVGTGLLFFRYPLQEHLTMLAAPGFERPQVLISTLAMLLGEDIVRSTAAVYLLFWLTTLFGITAFFGFFTRLSVGLFGLGMTLEVAHIYSYDELHHVHTMFVIFLMILAFSPCGDCLSWDAWRWRGRGARTESELFVLGENGRPWWEGSYSTLAMWPFVAIHILLALVYFDAASSKLIIGGKNWFNGYTMQQYLLEDGIRHDMPLGVWMAQFRELGIAMAVAAVAFEGLFFLVLIPKLRKIVPFVLLTGVGMHLGIYFMQKAPFFTWLMLYATWVPWERFVARPRGWGRETSTSDTAASPPGPAASTDEYSQAA